VVLRIDLFCQHAGVVSFVVHLAAAETGGEGDDGLIVQFGHQGQDSGTIDAAGQEQAIGNVGTLMDAHAVRQCRIQPLDGVVHADLLRPTCRQGLPLPPFDDPTAADHNGFAGKDAFDAAENGLPARGELQLQQFLPLPVLHRRLDQARGDQCLWFRCEGEQIVTFDVVQRFNAERVAGQNEARFRRVVNRDCVHSPQVAGEIDPVAPVQPKRNFTIRLRPERRVRHRPAQFHIVVDLAIRDQRGAARFV
jgi:hypothetical protein